MDDPPFPCGGLEVYSTRAPWHYLGPYSLWFCSRISRLLQTD